MQARHAVRRTTAKAMVSAALTVAAVTFGTVAATGTTAGAATVDLGLPGRTSMTAPAAGVTGLTGPTGSAGMGLAAQPASGAPGYRPVAIWNMNEGSGARTMVDSSGNGHDGTIGSEVLRGVTADGATGYRFTRLEPNTPPTHPQHLVTVPDGAGLDPGNRDYAVTIRLRTTYRFGNVVQKGQATVPGGNFKFQMPNGIIQCLFRGSGGTIMLSSHNAYRDGRWHVVRCERTTDRVTMTVDNVVETWRAGHVGTIANDWPVSIGGKTACDQVDVTCDYYAGDIDRVEIDAR
jgi:hypothetical protein